MAAEIICDGYHVHPAVATAAIRAKRVEQTMAITDGSAGAGLPVGSKVSLGGRAVTVTEDACFLDDGTLCGSRITMDAAFRRLLRRRPRRSKPAACAAAPRPPSWDWRGRSSPRARWPTSSCSIGSSMWSRPASAAFPPGPGLVQRYEPWNRPHAPAV